MSPRSTWNARMYYVVRGRVRLILQSGYVIVPNVVPPNIRDIKDIDCEQPLSWR